MCAMMTWALKKTVPCLEPASREEIDQVNVVSFFEKEKDNPRSYKNICICICTVLKAGHPVCFLIFIFYCYSIFIWTYN